MSGRGSLFADGDQKQPEERLEWLRFCVREGDDNFKSSLTAWMQEVEAQIVALRKSLNDLPNEYARKGPVW